MDPLSNEGSFWDACSFRASIGGGCGCSEGWVVDADTHTHPIGIHITRGGLHWQRPPLVGTEAILWFVYTTSRDTTMKAVQSILIPYWLSKKPQPLLHSFKWGHYFGQFQKAMEEATGPLSLTGGLPFTMVSVPEVYSSAGGRLEHNGKAYKQRAIVTKDQGRMKW